MRLLSWLFGTSSDGSGDTTEAAPFAVVNPANGLPMVDDFVDIAGNPFGTDASDIGGIHDCTASGSDWSGASDSYCSHWD